MSTAPLTLSTPSIQAVNIINILVCIISTLFSSSVVFILVYRYTKLVRGKSLVNIVLWIAIADTLVSFSLALGYPLAYGSPGLCYFQGFITFLFTRISWMFTFFLMLNCYGIIVRKRYIVHLPYVHAMVWMTNILWQCMYYATSITFGNANNAPTKCAIIASNDPSPYAPMRVFWINCIFIFLGIILLFIIVLTARIFYFYNTKDGRESITTADMKAYDAFKTMTLYPISMVVAYIPTMVYRLYTTTHTVDILTLNITFVFVPLYGLFLSLIFYTKTKAARQEWLIIYKRVFNITNETKEIELIDNVIHNDNINNDKDRIHRIIDV